MNSTIVLVDLDELGKLIDGLQLGETKRKEYLKALVEVRRLVGFTGEAC